FAAVDNRLRLPRATIAGVENQHWLSPAQRGDRCPIEPAQPILRAEQLSEELCFIAIDDDVRMPPYRDEVLDGTIEPCDVELIPAHRQPIAIQSDRSRVLKAENHGTRICV